VSIFLKEANCGDFDAFIVGLINFWGIEYVELFFSILKAVIHLKKHVRSVRHTSRSLISLKDLTTYIAFFGLA
jgi:hypothetical protein